jgi:hypothetical protein
MNHKLQNDGWCVLTGSVGEVDLLESVLVYAVHVCDVDCAAIQSMFHGSLANN